MTALDEALRALEKELREKAVASVNLRDGSGMQDAYNDAADSVAALLSSRQEVAPVADEYGWVEGSPHRILSKEEGEWFIAETTYGDRVVLKGLPEEYAYDFTTADSTYIKRDKIKRWRQFPDSEYKPLGDTGQTADARDAARLDWVLENAAMIETNGCGSWRVRFDWTTPVTFFDYRTSKLEAIDAAMESTR